MSHINRYSDEEDQISDYQISILENSIHWYITAGLIVKYEEKFFLILKYEVDGKAVNFSRSYPTIRGARIAFSKYFKERHFTFDPESDTSDENPSWSDFYTPSQQWLSRYRNYLPFGNEVQATIDA